MNEVFMPKGVAIWLVINTNITIRQISEFCKLSVLEVQAFSEAKIGKLPVFPVNPLDIGILSEKNIKECEADPTKPLVSLIEKQKKSTKYQYVQLVRRKQKISAIAWILKKYPHLEDEKIARLLKANINSVKSLRKKINASEEVNIEDPVKIGFCTKTALEELLKS